MSRLKQVRVKAGISMEQLVTASGVSRGTLRRAEMGKEAISPISASRIVNALNRLAGTNHTPESLNILVSEW